MTIIHSYRNRKRLGRDEGGVAIELGLAFPVMLLVVAGAIEFALAYWQWNTMLDAVEQVGRYIMINRGTCSTTACAETEMQAMFSNASVCAMPTPGQTCVEANSTANTPPTMTLIVRYNAGLIPLIGPLTITSRVTVPLI